MPFVSIEGIDGSGKTTQTELLALALSARSLVVQQTKEPDQGEMGRAIRAILVNQRESPLAPQEEMLLISAARFGHIRNLIRPALARDEWVVSDRFVDSTFAFQAFETGVSEQLFYAICSEVIGDTMPDFTFILDVPAEAAGARRHARGAEPTTDPAEETRDFSRIRRGFLEVVRRDPNRCRLINGTNNPEDITREILSIIFAHDEGESAVHRN